MSARASAYRAISHAVPVRTRSRLRVALFRAPLGSFRRVALANDFRNKARIAGASGSALYRTLLVAAAEDVLRRGPCWEVLAGYRPDRCALDDGLPWRFLAGVHLIVLEGGAPELAEHYPSAGRRASGDPWPVFREVVASNRERLQELIRRPCQTNDVTRTRALLPGFLTVARETGLPLRVLELGSSMGLCLRWDRFFYDYGDATWGDPGSPVRLAGETAGRVPALDADAVVAERRGCDLAPLDAASADDRLWLRASSFPEHERLRALDGALAVAQSLPVEIDRSDAVTWLEAQLAARSEGVATVVFHSVVLRYLTEADRKRVRSAIQAAGERADASAPLAWMSMEGLGIHEVRLTLWPGGDERVLARSDPQAHRIRWLG